MHNHCLRFVSYPECTGRYLAFRVNERTSDLDAQRLKFIAMRCEGLPGEAPPSCAGDGTLPEERCLSFPASREVVLTLSTTLEPGRRYPATERECVCPDVQDA